MDGTLLDTLADLAHACNTMLAAHGYPPHPTERYRTFVGNGFGKLVERVLPADVLATLAPDDFLLLMREAKAVYSGCQTRCTAPYAGIVDALDQLSAMGLRLAILSNKPDRDTQALARHYFKDRFDAVRGQMPNVPLKPDPTSLLDMLRGLGLAPEETLYVGDTATDMTTARNAGVFAIGVTWGFRPERELVESGADAIARHPDDIVQTARASRSRGM